MLQIGIFLQLIFVNVEKRFVTSPLDKPLKKSKHDIFCIPRNIENTVSFCLLLQNFYYFYSKIVDTGAGYAAGAGKVIGKLGKIGGNITLHHE